MTDKDDNELFERHADETIAKEKQFLEKATAERNNKILSSLTASVGVEGSPQIIQCHLCLKIMDVDAFRDHLVNYHRVKFSDMDGIDWEEAKADLVAILKEFGTIRRRRKDGE